MRARDKRGYILITLSLAIPLLCGLLGLAIDAAYMHYLSLNMQAAADAAALAGSRELGNGATAIASAAQGAATANGFTNGSNGVAVTVNNPPKAGTYSGNSNYVEAVIAQNQPTIFMSVLGFSSVTVSARAVSGSLPIYGDCIYVLDSSASSALSISGSGSLSSTCGVWINSNASPAMQISTGACLNVTSGKVNIVGGITDQWDTCSHYTTQAISGFSDPLAALAAPAWSSCDHAGQVSYSSGTATLNPGVYCGGINVGGSSSVVFNSGNYILVGGGLTVGNSGSAKGAGVMFYNTGNSTYSFAPITFSGASSANFTAPTSGTYNNVLFFEDRSKGGSSTQNSVAASAVLTATGAMYFKNSQFVFSGAVAIGPASMAIIADKVSISGSASVKDGLNGAAGGGTGSSGTSLAE